MRILLAAVIFEAALASHAGAQTVGQQDQAVSHSATTADTSASDSDHAGLAPEPPALTKLINWFDREVNQGGGPRDGFYPETGNMVTGSGWISAGPGYRRQFSGRRARVDASAAVSWNVYKMAQVRFELPRLANDRLSVGAQTLYQDMLQVNYFGVGND